jgi:hypothetical protein
MGLVRRRFELVSRDADGIALELQVRDLGARRVEPQFEVGWITECSFALVSSRSEVRDVFGQSRAVIV